MTPSKKLFLAAALVAVGYGVAALLGAPDPRVWPETWTPAGPPHSQPTTAASLSVDGPPSPAKVGSVRLLPESPVDSLARPSSAEALAASTPKSPSPPLLPAPPPVLETTRTNEHDRPQLSSRPLPRASLKNESPRPLPTADRPAAPKPVLQADATVYEQPITDIHASANNRVVSAGFASETPAPAPAYWSTNATPLQPIQSAHPPATVSPPPWPIENVEAERSHVIVDGDSLAKLAGRYLDDPRRSDEIFALNRGVLSDPELLPIGAELKIPSRGGAGAAGIGMPQSRKIGTSSLHAAAYSGLVPVRLPSTSGLTPRAQLLPPRPAE